MRSISAFLIALIFAVYAPDAQAGPGDILFSDNFDDGAGCSALAPWTTDVATQAGIGTQTANSGSCSLFTRHGAVSVTSNLVDLSSVPGATLEAWVRKGADAFSEDPDGGEDLVVEFFDSTNTWVQLQIFSANTIADGAITNLSVSLPFSALHANFQMRFRQLGGSGVDFDYWHVDDVTIIEAGAPLTPNLSAYNCDDFEGGLRNFTATDLSRAGTGPQTSNSPNNALFLRHGTVEATSVSISALALSSISVWVRRGSDAFSEDPDAGENLVIEAFDNTGAWVELETFQGTGTQGEIFNRVYTPTPNLLHANLRIRFRLTNASGADFDYWHVDDLCFTSSPPNIAVQKTSAIVSDPINGTANPKLIPGAIVRYSVTITNTGIGIVDDGSVVVTDTLPPDTSLFVGDLNGSGSPFIITDGTGANSTGLSVNFVSLGSNADGIIFFDSGGNAIVPTPDFDGTVASFVIDLDGPIAGTAGGGTPIFTIEFEAQIE